MKEALDRFSKQSSTYKKFRPTYPAELFEFLYATCPNQNVAWDCGTGNGQVACILAESFEKVLATDISETQIQNADSKENIFYSVERSEKTSFQSSSIDLITVAQAIHWFDFSAFNKEVRRVLKPNGIIAVWGYGLLRIDSRIDRIVDYFYKNKIGRYWDKERKHIDNHYDSIKFDLGEIEVTEEFQIQTHWTMEQLKGYFNSWSSVQNYIKQNNGTSPVDKLMKEIALVWTEGSKQVTFLIFVRIGKK